MLKRVCILLIFAAFLVGCAVPIVPTTPANDEPTATDSALPTVQPLVVVITATPFSPSESGTGNATAVVPFASPTAGAAAIKITGVDDLGNGRAMVHWDANGDFPSGFQVVFSSVHENPTFPTDPNSYYSDPNARSAIISSQVSQIYYVKVCRYINDTCDMYSNLGIFALFPSTKTPTLAYNKTKTPSTIYGTAVKTTTYNSLGTPISSTNSIVINKMTDAGTGKAHMYWTAVGTFAKGFKIVYSKTDSTPTFGENPYYAIADGAIREAYIDGATGTKYYYRICRYTGSTCDIYSATYTFTYAGTAMTNTPDPATLTLTGVTETSPHVATVNWNATGTFPNGFKILYSKTHATPTLSDSFVAVSDGTLRTGTFTGTAGSSYYVRVCKYFASACVAYSNVMTITFAGPTPTTDPATITVTGVADGGSLGMATVNWTDSGSFPSGFKILYSETNPTPDVGDIVVLEGSGSATFADITGTPGATYYVAVCKNIGGTCGAYSNVVTYTFPADTATITLDSITDTASGTALASWTATGTFGEGFKFLISDTNNPPTLSDTVVLESDGTLLSSSITGTPGTTYYVRMCKVFGSGCTVYSNVLAFTFAKIDVTDFADTSSGNATLKWTASGSFPNGFKILYSSSVNPPTLSDTVVTIASGATRTGAVTGTAGTAYHFRVCQWDGASACIVYSPVMTYTFAQINLTSATETGTGEGTLVWTADGDFLDGFALLYKVEDNTTNIATDNYLTIADGTTTSTVLSTPPSAFPGVTIYYRLCQLITPTTCGVYSNERSITYAPEITLTLDGTTPGQMLVGWNLLSATPSNGYVILRGDGSTDPIIANTTVGTALSTDTSFIDSTIGGSGTQYVYRVCGYNGTNYTSCTVANGVLVP